MKRFLIAVILFAPGCSFFKTRDSIAPQLYSNVPEAGTASMSSNPDLDGRLNTRQSAFDQLKPW
jgi:hypothetical protein